MAEPGRFQGERKSPAKADAGAAVRRQRVAHPRAVGHLPRPGMRRAYLPGDGVALELELHAGRRGMALDQEHHVPRAGDRKDQPADAG